MPNVKNRRPIVVVGVVIIVLGGLLATEIHRSHRQSMDSLKSKATTPLYDFPGTFYLRTVPISTAMRDNMLGGDYNPISRVSEIPNSCREDFTSSFTTISGLRASSEELALADPGRPFQASDNITPGLPFRRLVFGGYSSANCFLYYQSGGGPPSFCLAMVDYTRHKVVWAGESPTGAHDIDELRRMIRQHTLEDDLGQGC